jgi:glycosyltransferase involved in cell wall biosynthesis
VCSNRPPLDELYGQASLLVNPLDPADVARQLDQLLTRPGLRKELVARGRELVRERTWEAVALQTAQAYLEAIELGPTAMARQLRRRRAA